MKPPGRNVILPLGLAAMLCACTDAGLDRIPVPPSVRDDKIAVTGDLCTTPPESRVFPLRVLFVVDASESMRINDPPDPVTGETGRERAVRETWQRLLDGSPEGVRIGIIRFSAEAQSATPVDQDMDGVAESYFTADQVKLDVATRSLSETDRTTNYINALSEAYFVIRTELLNSELDALPLSRYVVVFVSDGIPDTDNSEERDNTEENILDGVGALKELGKLFHVGQIEFDTAYLSSGTGSIQDQAAEKLLEKMSAAGEGAYRSFPSGESLNFLFVDFTAIRRVFTLQSLLVTNLNAFSDLTQVDGLPAPIDPRAFVDVDGDEAPSCGEPLVDSDSDGLADAREAELGTSPLVRDTDDDGLDDRLEWRLASSDLDPLDPTDARCYIPAPCTDTDGDGWCDCVFDLNLDGVCDCTVDPDRPCADAAGHDCLDADADSWCDCPDLDGDGLCDYGDRDGDGLNDCEEVYFGTAQRGNDTDADGLPDWQEVRARSNPGERDWLDDGDWDLTVNGAELLANTDAWCDESEVRSLVSYRYDLDTTGIVDGRTCYTFSADNITIVPTAANPAARYPGNGWNRILVYAGEVSFDDPDAFAAYRIACVMARYEPDGDYRNPPSGHIVLTDADFVQARDFDANTDCKWP